MKDRTIQALTSGGVVYNRNRRRDSFCLVEREDTTENVAVNVHWLFYSTQVLNLYLYMYIYYSVRAFVGM